MADRSVTIKFSADMGTAPQDLTELAALYDRVADSATKAGNVKLAGISRTTRQLGDDADKAAPKVGKLGAALSTIDRQSANLNRIGGTLTGIGVAGTLGLGAVTKAAIDWESAWAGVTKTVDGTPQQMADLEKELRGLATTLPATHEEIAGIAEAAGQLGVKREDITSFTRTMVDLSETTNLTADEAATSLAQFMNIMGTAGGDVDNLASTIVALGNDGASTERDIVQMGLRIAGAGRTIGLSESDVLAYANALASVGIEAEAGGTAISTSFLRIEQAVRSGGSELDLLAKTAGVSSAEFAEAFRTDAAGALNDFIVGLGGVQQQGGDTTAILKDLGITGIRESDALRRLASSGDLLSESLSLGAESIRSNAAISAEAAKRYETDASKIQVASNKAKDSAIDAGAALAPVFVGMAESVAGAASAFGDLDPAVQGFLAKAGLVVTATGLLGGGALQAATGGVELYKSFKELQTTSGPTAGRLAAVGKAAAGLGAAAAAVGGIYALSDALDKGLNRSLEETTGALLGYAAGKNALEGSFEIGNELVTVDEALTRVGENRTLDEWDSKVFSAFGSSQGVLNQLEAQFGAVDQSLNSLVSSGATDEAAASFRRLADSAAAQQIPAKRLVELFPEYADQVRATARANGEKLLSDEQLVAMMTGRLDPALHSVGDSAGGAASGVAAAGQSMKDSATDAEVLAEESQKVIDKFTILRDGALSVERANIGWEESLDTLAAGTKEARKAAEDKALADGKSEEAARAAADAELEGAAAMDESTEAGRTSRRTVLDAVSALNDKVTADYQATASTGDMEKAERDAAKALREGREDILDNAEAAGVNREKVDDLTEAVLKTPDELKIDTTTPGMKAAQEAIAETKRRLQELRDKTIEIKMNVTGDSKATVLLNEQIVKKYGASGRQLSALAVGGAVPDTVGLGRQKYDTIPAMLRVDEHVWTPEEVDAAGGHSAMYRMRRAALAGDLAHYDRGGAVNRKLQMTMADVHPGLMVAGDTFSQVAGAMATSIGSAVGSALAKKIDEATSTGMVGGKVVPLGSGDLVSFKGMTFTENFANRLKKVEDQVGAKMAITQGGFRPRTPYSGTSHEGDAVDLAGNHRQFILPMRRAGIAAGDRTGLGNWISHTHAVPTAGAGRAAGSAVWQAQDYLAKGGVNQPLNSTWGLAGGGTIYGPGGPTDDRIHVRLSSGENVTNAYSTAVSPQLLRDINYGRITDRNYIRASPTPVTPSATNADLASLTLAFAGAIDYRKLAAATRAGTHAGVREGMSNVHWETSAVDVTAVGVVA